MSIKEIFRKFKQNRIKNLGTFDLFLPVGKLNRTGEEDEYYDKEEWEYSKQKKSYAKSPIFILRLIIIVMLLVFGWRLLSLQIEQGSANYTLAEGNRLRVRYIMPSRGLIYDRNGVPLVKNVPTFSLTVYPSEIPSITQDKEDYINNLSQIIKMNPDELKSKIEAMSKKQQSFVLLEGLDREKALDLELLTEKLPGVVVDIQPSREYLSVSGLSHIIGYVGKVSEDDLTNDASLLPSSLIGKAGIEYVYDKELRGSPGLETIEVDSKGREIRQVSVEPPKNGKSIYLTVDKTIQDQAATSLQTAMNSSKAKNGVAIATDVTNGEIISMVSLPDYDNNIFLPQGDQSKISQVLNDPSAPLLNRAISGLYPSGSTIKPVVASGALQEGVINGSTKLDTSEGKITIGQWTFPDWKVHGIADVRQAIAESNNIFFYSLGGGYKNIKGLGVDKLTNTLKEFGFGELSGIDLPGEEAGLVPNPDWKKKNIGEDWFVGDTYNLAIGQGFLEVTPLQLNLSSVTVANGGKLFRPHILKTTTSGNSAIDVNPNDMVRRSNFVSNDNLQIVREGMRQAVTSGSARSFNSLGVQVAAKTGTAQFDTTNIAKTHSWFTCFAPYDSPKIAVTTIVEGGGEGYLVAAPVAKNMIEKYFNLPISPISIPTNTNE